MGAFIPLLNVEDTNGLAPGGGANGPPSKPEAGKVPAGGTPEGGTPTGPPLPIEEGKDPEGGLPPKGKDGPAGRAVGGGATFGGNVGCWVPKDLGTTPGGGGPGRDTGGERVVEGKGGVWANGVGLGVELSTETGRFIFIFWKLSDNALGFCCKLGL